MSLIYIFVFVAYAIFFLSRKHMLFVSKDTVMILGAAQGTLE
jgi:hypothetical protein